MGSAELLPQTEPQAPDNVPCDQEAIRVPGSVQQHGMFMLTDSAFERVLVASDNADRILGVPLKLILGARLDTLLERELLSALQLHTLRCESKPADMVSYLGTYRVRDEFVSVVSHCIGDTHALEFEIQNRIIGPEMMNAVITNFVATLARVQSEGELCEALTRQIAELTGFDRILLYSFDEEGHGDVRAEVSNDRLPSYLGLRFPASDIPRQARELYLLNTVRIIPDANYDPSPLVGIPGESPSALDLSQSVLRSVSPVHLQYMRNMGTLASMSLSIVSEGRLWGLVSGHHAEPRTVPYLVRSACDMLTRMASTQLTAFRTSSRLKEMLHFHAVQRDILTHLAAEQNYLEGLVQQLGVLRQVTNASGVALVTEDQIARNGELPEHASLRRIAAWLDQRPEMEVVATSKLEAELPWAAQIRDLASGLIAIRVSSVQQRYLMWFRPEVVSTVRWAGEPQDDDAKQLSPRASFNEWKQTVRGRSEPWSAVEIDSARDFRAALTTIGLRRAEEAVELGEARFQQLTHALPAKIFTANDQGELTYVNDRWTTQGLRPRGRWFDDPALAPEDAERCAEGWQSAVADGKAFEAEIKLQPAPDQPARWNFVRAVPFQRTGASRAGWIGTFIDLTESKERELALRMTEKLALTGRMTSVIAHEINNPLEAITNLMYLLRSELPKDGPAPSYIGMVESELERISGITKQTLRWNRESQDLREQFDARALVEDVLRLFAGKIRNREISMRLAGAFGVKLTGVIGQIRQVLTNLISNAIDASPVGGKVSVTILQTEAGSGFAVQDNGGGIPAHIRNRMFEPFFSTKGDLGNGLGLYISREIVERHGGTIEVESETSGGTTMRVLLPLA